GQDSLLSCSKGSGLSMRLVMKFGGTAVDSGDKIKHVADIVTSYKKKNNDIVCIVSAVRGLTDGLLSISDSVKKGDKTSIETFVNRAAIIHREIAEKGISDPLLRRQALEVVNQTVKELVYVLGRIVFQAE